MGFNEVIWCSSVGKGTRQRGGAKLWAGDNQRRFDQVRRRGVRPAKLSGCCGGHEKERELEQHVGKVSTSPLGENVSTLVSELGGWQDRSGGTETVNSLSHYGAYNNLPRLCKENCGAGKAGEILRSRWDK